MTEPATALREAPPQTPYTSRLGDVEPDNYPEIAREVTMLRGALTELRGAVHDLGGDVGNLRARLAPASDRCERAEPATSSVSGEPATAEKEPVSDLGTELRNLRQDVKRIMRETEDVRHDVRRTHENVVL